MYYGELKKNNPYHFQYYQGTFRFCVRDFFLIIFKLNSFFSQHLFFIYFSIQEFF